MSRHRAPQMRILADAATAPSDSPDFTQLLTMLRLTADHRGELLRVLAAGRWRRAVQPFEYVRRRVLACGQSRDLWTKGEAVPVPSADDSEVSDVSDFSERISAMRNDDCDNSGPSLYDLVRPEFCVVHPETRVVSVNWDAIGRELALPPLQLKVLRLMLDGAALGDALRQERRADTRKRLTAAWIAFEARLPEIRGLILRR